MREKTMRWMIKLLICVCLVPAAAAAQKQIGRVVVGPSGDQFRIVYTVIHTLPDAYEWQTMMIDIPRGSSGNEEPTSVQAELTLGTRSRATKVRKQKTLTLRWKKTGELELKCDGNWTKQGRGLVKDKILETTKIVIQSVLLNTKAPNDVSVTPEVEQKISVLLNSLNTEAVPCFPEVQLP